MINEKKNRGFSLIELLLAITILSIVMIMVTQFMGTSSVALTKTKKNLNIQTEAMEVGNKLSDILVQATYIRVRTQDHQTYELDLGLDGNTQKRVATPTTKTVEEDLVVDNYPNFLNLGTERKIILNEDNYRLRDEDNPGVFYPQDGSVVTQSFRLLTSNRKDSGIYDNPLYVMPQYIYIRYTQVESGLEKESYVILFFDNNNECIYMDRGTYAELLASSGGFPITDGFDVAIDRQTSKMTASNGQTGLLSEHVKDCYFSADAESNTIYLNMLFEDERYEEYTYNYAEVLTLRNSNVLTVEPQKMFKSN